MEMYDLVVVGGGIGGSVAARFSAANGMKTLLVEQAKVPRNKVCTGLQFTYFENLIGAKIPADKLCRNELDTMQIILPSGRNFSASIELLNFWRTNFDHWLNELAAAEGAIFQDETIYIHHEEESGHIAVTLEAHGQQRKVYTRYVIGADGANSRVREVIRPQDFITEAKGGIWCYYVEGSSLLDAKTVYMFYNVDFATLTFGTMYRKDDEWLIATGADHAPEEYIERFYTYVKQKYLLTGEITRRESFASNMVGGPYLGTGNLLMVGDAAGLLDPYRMLGMDNAALSGRLAIKSILVGEKLNRPVLNCYQDEMQDILESLAEGAIKQEARYTNNDTLEASMTSPEFLFSGLKTVTGELIARHLPPEDIITLPE
jgi:flavin-dependent dehydrogenase